MTLLAAVLIAGYGLLLLVLALRQRTRRDAETQWLLLTLIVALIGDLFLLPVILKVFRPIPVGDGSGVQTPSVSEEA